MGKRIDGKEIALGIKEEIKAFVNDRKLKGLSTPKVASILVGNDGGSIFYLNNQGSHITRNGIWKGSFKWRSSRRRINK